MNIGDLLKEPVWLKMVPDAEPNADGEWVLRDLSEQRIQESSWDYLSSLLPKGYHCVKLSRDLPKGGRTS